MLLFIYGTLKKSQERHKTIKSAIFIANVKTAKKYPFYLSDFYYPILFNVENIDKCVTVEGELYEIDEKVFEQLNILEGVPNLYNSYTIEVEDTQGKKYKCLCYMQTKKQYLKSRHHLYKIEKFPQRVNYFAYGSNTDEEQMRSRKITFYKKDISTLANYEMVFNKKNLAGDHSYANIQVNENKNTMGILYQIDIRSLALLDCHEGYPLHYDRIIIKTDEGADAYCYIANKNFIDNSLNPSDEYIEKINNGKKHIEDLKRKMDKK